MKCIKVEIHKLGLSLDNLLDDWESEISRELFSVILGEDRLLEKTQNKLRFSYFDKRKIFGLADSNSKNVRASNLTHTTTIHTPRRSLSVSNSIIKQNSKLSKFILSEVKPIELVNIFIYVG